MGLEKPIFLVGTGRCGSSVIHDLLARHPEVAFLSGLCEAWPDRPRYNGLAMRLIDLPLGARWARQRLYPVEAWTFWDNYVRGFSIPFRDLGAHDVRPNEKARIRAVLGGMCTSRRRRLLVKLTGWPRFGFLSEIFADAQFIHVVRDGRAVANSMVNSDFWRGWGGPGHWQFGPLSPEHQAEWEQYDQSFLVLAAIQWKMLMAAFEEAKRNLSPAQYLEVKYENVVADPQGVFGTMLHFCRLPFPAEFRDAVGRFDFRSANEKWQEDLTGRQREMLNRCLKDSLVRYGYEGLDGAGVRE